MPSNPKQNPRLLSLYRTHQCPGYQFCAKIRYIEKDEAEECFTYVVNTVTQWLRLRVGGEYVIPDLLATSAGQDDSVATFRTNEGFAADIIYHIEEKAWAMRLREPDSGTEERLAVVGRFFVTDIGIQKIDNKWIEMGVHIDILEPAGSDRELEYAFRPGFVRTLFMNPDLQIEHITRLTADASLIETIDDLEELQLILEDKENCLPVVVFTPTYNAYTIEELIKRIDEQTKWTGTESSLSQFFANFDHQQKVEIGNPSWPYDVEGIGRKLFAYGRVYGIRRCLFEQFSAYCDKHHISIQPGDAVLFNPGSSFADYSIYSYSKTEGKSAPLEENTAQILETVKSLAKVSLWNYNRIGFQPALSEKYRKARIRALRETKQNSDEYFNEMVLLDDENRNLKQDKRQLEARVDALIEQLSVHRKKEDQHVEICLPDIQEFYTDEMHDLIISVLMDAVGKYAMENSRASDLLKQIVDKNELTGAGLEFFAQLKTILFRNKNITQSDVSDLEELGISVSSYSNNHYKLKLQGNEKYQGTLPSTGSDYRGMKNSYTELKNMWSVYKSTEHD